MQLTLYYLDVETRSDRDLLKVGSWNYSKSPHAGINALSLVGPNVMKGRTFTHDECKSAATKEMVGVKKILDAPDVVIVCHNAKFEADVVLNVLGWNFPANKWRCTMAKCGYYDLPQSLNYAAQTLELPLLKDMGAGSRAMKVLCKVEPNGKYITPKDRPDLYDDLYPYCLNDSQVCKLLNEKLPPLPAMEQAVWEMDFRINRLGIPLDWFLIHNAAELVDRLQAAYDERVWGLTSGELNSTRQVKALLPWLQNQGVDVQNVSEDSIDLLLLRQDLSDRVREILEIRQEQSASSLAKFKKMLLRMDNFDHRLRGEFWYYGAHTGRWSSAGVQTMNLVKGYDESLCNALASSNGDWVEALFEKPLRKMTDGVRGAIACDEKHVFLGVDLSQIEDRFAMWLAGQDNILELYAAGRDVYSDTASELFQRKITKADNPDERQAGKISRLSLNFGGGIGAIERNALKTGFDLGALRGIIKATPAEELDAVSGMNWYYDQQNGTLPEDLALICDVIKQRWRKSHPYVVRYWHELIQAFIRGEGICGLIKIASSKGSTRVVTLPSKRQLFYRSAKIYADGTITYEGREGTKTLIKGKFFENLVQAGDSDVSRFYMLQAEKFAPIVHHSHDEYLLEVPVEKFDTVYAKVNELHSTQFPKWTKGLPIAFETWSGVRYEK